MDERSIIYFGNDKIFSSSLLQSVATIPNQHIKILNEFSNTESGIQSLFLSVSVKKPDAVLIDLSLFTEDFLHLARILRRTPFEKEIHYIVLLDNNQPDSILIQAQSTGVSLTFIKSDNITDITFTLLRLLYPKKSLGPQYVRAKINSYWQAGIIGKVGYSTNKGLHIETNYEIKKYDRIKLSHFWCNKAVIPSKEVRVTNVEERGLAYYFKYAVDVEFEYIDNFKTSERSPEDDVKRFNLIEDAKYRYQKLFSRNIGSSSGKIAKVMILDEKFTIYNNAKRSDRHPYMIRCLGNTNNIIFEIKKFVPHIIVCALDDQFNSETLSSIVKETSKSESLPFFILFNSERSTKEWCELLGIKQVLASKDDVNIELLIKLANSFEKKIGQHTLANEKRIYLSKNKEESNCSIEIDIKVDWISETDIMFQSSEDIPLHSNLVINKPVKALVYIHEKTQTPHGTKYLGIIHSNSELTKNALRRFINSALFPDDEDTNTEK